MDSQGRFSSSILSADLDDFIAPAQACILPLNGGFQAHSPSKKVVPPPGSVATPIYSAPSAKKNNKTAQHLINSSNDKNDDKDKDSKAVSVAKVTLSDCLACSGCVTSAETVLLDQQSTNAFYRALNIKVNEGNSSTVSTSYVNSTSDLERRNNYVVVSLSQQSIASIAQAENLTMKETAQRIVTVLKELGVEAVFDLTMARFYALEEAAREFIQMKKSLQKLTRRKLTNLQTGNPSVPKNSPPEIIDNDASASSITTSTITSMTTSHSPGASCALSSTLSSAATTTEPKFTLINSTCPGFTVYVEKTHGNDIIPFLSQVKSPQAIMGSLIKQHMDRILPGAVPEGRSIWHCTVMPCYDKKLEAARNEFVYKSCPEIDCVLTTTELVQVIQHHRSRFPSSKEIQVQETVSKNGMKKQYSSLNAGTTTERSDGNDTNIGTNTDTETNTGKETNPDATTKTTTSLLDHVTKSSPFDPFFKSPTLADLNNVAFASTFGEFNGSGGYLEYIMQQASCELLNLNLDEVSRAAYVETSMGRNSDLRYYTVRSPDNQQTLRFASAYGFRNIQNIIRKIKQGKCEFDYIEIMSCPSGCTNGGGQIKSKPGQDPNLLAAQVQQKYKEVEIDENLFKRDTMTEMYDVFIQDYDYDMSARLFRTSFYERKQSSTSVLQW